MAYEGLESFGTKKNTPIIPNMEGITAIFFLALL
jgi:hypothetical protein